MVSEGMHFLFVCFRPILFPLPPTLMIQLAEVLRTKLCECVNTSCLGDEAMNNSMHVHLLLFSSFSYSLHFFLLWLFLSPLAFACFSQSWSQVYWAALRAVPCQSEWNQKTQGGVSQTRTSGHSACVPVGKLWLDQRSKLNSVKSPHLRATFQCNINAAISACYFPHISCL